MTNTHKIRNRVALPLLAAATLGGSLALAGCGSSDSVVRYEVTGGAPAQVSYYAMAPAPNMTTLVSNQQENWNLPSTREFHVPKNDKNDYMLTATQTPGNGPISCKITVDGKVVAEQHAQSSGYFSGAVCSKLTPVNPSDFQ